MPKAPLSDPLTIRLPRDVLTDIETIAATAERSRNRVIVRALRAYLLAEGADMLDIAGGLKDTRQDGSWMPRFSERTRKSVQG